VVSETRARELAEEFSRKAGRTFAPTVTELERGWYFAWGDDGLIGSHGFAVSKETGRIFEFGSAFPRERDLRMYDRGMDADAYDLVVLAIADLDASIAVLQLLRPNITELSYETGTVWRIPRPLTEDELRVHLANLPAIFPDINLYVHFEAVEEARSSGCCVMEVIPRNH
jgi:hypothetical protein